MRHKHAGAIRAEMRVYRAAIRELQDATNAALIAIAGNRANN